MSLATDYKYINIISTQLERFQRKGNNLYNFRCPFCGDSSKNKFKARGYFFVKNNNYFYKCHNCSIGYSLPSFLKAINISIHKQYVFEKFSNNHTQATSNKQENKFVFDKPIFKIVQGIEKLNSLEDKHPAKRFMVLRKLPDVHMNTLYYTDDFQLWVSNYIQDGTHLRLKEKESRIVIPFYDTEGNIIACQGRSIQKDNPLRYITIRFDKSKPKIFGLERWNKQQKTYVFEGPIDSLFVPNSLAMAGSDITQLDIFDNVDTIFCYDNEPRNKQIVHKISNLIDLNYNVVIWPSSNKFKDINDMIVGGYDQTSLIDMINKNTFSGLKAKIKLNNWKRI